MKVPSEYAARIAEFPAALRALIEAELAAGNEIVEVASCFPAPPVGAYVKLNRPVSTRPRASGSGIDFYDRNSSLYSGEFTDAKRFFFVLEPPRPPEPEPDMDAIRASHQPQSPVAAKPSSGRAPSPARGVDRTFPAGQAKAPTAVERFRQSMILDYEKWHDGIGYDLDALYAASPKERAAIEALLLQRGVEDWRDVEALAAIDSPRARAKLKTALQTGDHEVRIAVTRYAPELASVTERASLLVSALENAELTDGLSEALDEVEEFHPPMVIEALFRGALWRRGEAAVHFAAMLMFLHGRAETAFDWEQRPFYLRFHTEDSAGRAAVFRELCEKIGVDGARYLASKRRRSGQD